MLMLVMIFIVTTGYFVRELWTKTLQTIELARLVEDLEAELDEAPNRCTRCRGVHETIHRSE